MTTEPEVDPYFVAALHSGDRKRAGDALLDYLRLYLEPKIVDKIIFVEDSFFFPSESTEDYRYVPRYQGFEKIDAPDVGSIIIDIDSVIREGSYKSHKLFHSVLIYCMMFGYLIENPGDDIFKRDRGWGRGGTLISFSNCFLYDLFKREYGPRPRIVYIPTDLNALYLADSASPEEVIVLKRTGDKIVVNASDLHNHYSFVVRHHYQEDEFDALPQEIVETMIQTWDIDEIINRYRSGKLCWLNDQVLASTFGWADDGFVYALFEGTDQLVDTFISRYPKKVQTMVRGEIVLSGKRETDRIEPKGSIPIQVLRRKSSRLDKLFLWQRQLTGEDLLYMENADRWDLLGQVDPEKLKEVDEEDGYPLFYYLDRLLELISKKYQNIDNIEELIKTYWLLYKDKIEKNGVYLDGLNLSREDQISREIDTVERIVVHGITYDHKLYDILKKIDPVATDRWLSSIEVPIVGYRSTNDWELFVTDEMYEELNRVNPITDEMILEYLKRLNSQMTSDKNEARRTWKKYRGDKTLEDVIKGLKVNSILKKPIKGVLRENWLKLD